KAATARPAAPARGRDWRPGGTHQDPKQRYKDAKKDRNLRARRERFERRSQGAGTDRPEQPARRPESETRPWSRQPKPSFEPSSKPSSKPSSRPAFKPRSTPPS